MDPSRTASTIGRGPVYLNEIFDKQKAAFQQNPYPDLHERRRWLHSLQDAVSENGEAIARALCADFGQRSVHETRLLEVFVSQACLHHASHHLRRWMKPEKRPTSLWFLPGKSRVYKQPLGVVGIIVPWNYPLYLAIGPMASALAAGNRVMLKMSELAPAFGKLFASIIAGRFPDDLIAVINGDPDVAQAFSALPFDHLLFTGSTAVGRSVMNAASRNLTPVTLELGGKSPAVVGPDFPIRIAAARIIFGKCLNAGQTCIAPDYVLLPSGKERDFIVAAGEEVARLYRSIESNPDYSSIINGRHFERLKSLLEECQAGGALVEGLHTEKVILYPGSRKIAPVAVLNATGDMRIMQEEIFGPLLPIVPYRSLEDAIRYVNDRPRPLALYYFDNDSSRVNRVLKETVSGGVTVNDTIFHIAQDSLPFGGVGPSGMGDYHGEEGFETFSKKKAVFYQARFNGIGLLKPPYGKKFEKVLNLMISRVHSQAGSVTENHIADKR
jgi:coniferyl-aldehyde dehydrogenase